MAKGQKEHCMKFLSQYIDKLEEQAEEDGVFEYGTVEIGYVELTMLYNVLNAQTVKEPMDDVVFFAGMPEMDSPCYHILVRSEDWERMSKNPYIHLCHLKKFTGVMEQDNKPKKKLTYDDKGHAFCGECGTRMYPRYRPSHCRKCGTMVDWSNEYWYKEIGE